MKELLHTHTHYYNKKFNSMSVIEVHILQVIVEFFASLQWSSDSVSLRVEGEGEGLVRSLRHNLTLLLYPQ